MVPQQGFLKVRRCRTLGIAALLRGLSPEGTASAREGVSRNKPSNHKFEKAPGSTGTAEYLLEKI